MTDADPAVSAYIATGQVGDLPALMRLQASARPDQLAVVQGDEAWSYARLDAVMDRVAAALHGAGEGPGGAVAICALTSPAYLAVFLGAVRAGLAAAPLAPSATPESLSGMIADAGARFVFADAHGVERLGPLPEGTTLIRLDTDQLDAWLAPEGAEPPLVALGPDDPFNIIYSSGTTGAPKGIVQSHGMRWNHLVPRDPPGYGPDAVTMIATPLYSNTTLVCVLPTLAGGGTLVTMPKFDAGEYLRLAERHRATHTMLVPVQYRRLMDHDGFDAHDLSSFRTKFCTSAPFPAALKRQVLDRWPGGLIEYFGMTEGGGTCMLVCHEHPDKLATVGQPAPGHDIRVIGDDGRELPPGQPGEVVGRSKSMMLGYKNAPDKTEAARWIAPDGQVFIRTGDVGVFDEDGFLTLVDRKKDVIISGGFNVFPSDIEAVLGAQDGVVECAVVGVPSDAWGETPVGFAVVREGAPSADALREAVNARVGKTQRLSDLLLVEELPRSAIGKVLKRELAARYRAA